MQKKQFTLFSRNQLFLKILHKQGTLLVKSLKKSLKLSLMALNNWEQVCTLLFVSVLELLLDKSSISMIKILWSKFLEKLPTCTP